MNAPVRYEVVRCPIACCEWERRVEYGRHAESEITVRHLAEAHTHLEVAEALVSADLRVKSAAVPSRAQAVAAEVSEQARRNRSYVYYTPRAAVAPFSSKGGPRSGMGRLLTAAHAGRLPPRATAGQIVVAVFGESASDSQNALIRSALECAVKKGWFDKHTERS